MVIHWLTFFLVFFVIFSIFLFIFLFFILFLISFLFSFFFILFLISFLFLVFFVFFLVFFFSVTCYLCLFDNSLFLLRSENGKWMSIECGINVGRGGNCDCLWLVEMWDCKYVFPPATYLSEISALGLRKVIFRI